MRKLTIRLIAFAIIFSACGVIVRAAKQKLELESASMPLGSRTFAPHGGMPAVHDEELY
jgi:hypothetical protein